MQPEPAALLWHARRAAEFIGESLDRLGHVDPETAERIADIPRIVAFRNVLIHGYATIDDAIVWEVATERLPGLVNLLSALLDCACLIVVDGASGTVEEPASDERDIDEEPTSLLNLPEDDESDLAVDQDVAELGGVADVSLRLEATPTDLSEGSFFQTLIGAALDRMPVAVYPEVRSRRRAALTGSP